jgi:hypothetical protein
VVRALELAEALEAERDRVSPQPARNATSTLRRDLHAAPRPPRRPGPSLSGVGLGLQALQDAQAAGDAAAADQLLGRIREEVATAVSEVRRILEDLRPAVLDRARLPHAVRSKPPSPPASWMSRSMPASFRRCRPMSRPPPTGSSRRP